MILPSTKAFWWAPWASTWFFGLELGELLLARSMSCRRCSMSGSLSAARPRRPPRGRPQLLPPPRHPPAAALASSRCACARPAVCAPCASGGPPRIWKRLLPQLQRMSVSPFRARPRRSMKLSKAPSSALNRGSSVVDPTRVRPSRGALTSVLYRFPGAAAVAPPTRSRPARP